ncbi:MAG: hypothetical protein L3K16_08810 [Thermoplasmata archaeon]|nr:hypothetical protein [Thermoplasmata archaeon]
MTKVVRVPVPGHRGEFVELVDHSPREVREFLREYFGSVSTRPSEPRSPADRIPTEAIVDALAEPDPAARRTAPKWQSVLIYLNHLDPSNGSTHTTEDVFRKFFGRKLSYVTEKSLAKATGTTLRKAHRQFAINHPGGSWIGEGVGARNRGGTTRWRFLYA